MDTAKPEIEILLSAEKRLRERAAELLAAGNYDEASRVMDLARRVGLLASDPEAGNNSVETSSASGAALRVADDIEVRADIKAPQNSTREVAARSKRKPGKDEYPKFFRRNDQLVKLGWSKKEKEEYEHKAPRRVVDALAAAIARRSSNGKLFTADDLFPLKDPQDGSEIPGYQGYVALAWFKVDGLIAAHGRRGYSVKRADRLSGTVGDAWLRLQEEKL